jgi:aromatic ring-opening dioxygenase LigB subunit
MSALGARCQAAAPETIIVYTPHGLAIPGFISISVGRKAAGTVDAENGGRIASMFRIDADFAREICFASAARDVPTVQVAFDKQGEPVEYLPLDWGALVPLWFMGARWDSVPEIVVACPDRSLPRRKLIEFGRATAEAAEESRKRIAIICSADQGHGHATDGPYGFAKESASYDRAYCRAIAEDKVDRMVHWRSDWIKAAMPDSYWQTLMLHGALQHVPMKPEILSYEAPTYFGMACVAYERSLQTS